MKHRVLPSWRTGGRVGVALVLGGCLGMASLQAQGTRADYERANHLRELTANKVFKQRIQPHWFAGNQAFWYRNDLPDHRREFIRVDAARGRRAPAFDHQRLAAAWAKVAQQKFTADKLPLDKLAFKNEGTELVFSGIGKWWACDLADYTVRETRRDGQRGASLKAETDLRPTRRTGEETWITFVNRTAQTVKLYWLTPENERRQYAVVKAGQRHRQHTFAGHVWLATDAAGKALAVFEATEGGGEAVIAETHKGRVAPERKAPRGRNRSGQKSPDGRWLAQIQDHNVHLVNLEDNQEFALSRDGTEADAYSGRLHWSPDAKKLVALRTLKGQERQIHFIESSPKDQLQPKLHTLTYAKPGDKIPLAKPQLFDVVRRRHVPVSDALFPNPWSIRDVRWAPDSSRFTFVYNQRGHQVLRLVAVEAATGRARAIIDEHSDTFIDYAHKQFAHYLDQTGEIIWMSERDGWNHLYLYDGQTGKVKNQITRGEWVVRGVERVDADQRQIWFRAGGIRPEQDPYYIHYCRINFDGTGLVILTAGDGTHSVQFSPDRKYFIDTWSRVDFPPVNELRRSCDGKLMCELERADWSALLQTGWQAPERFVAKGRDGRTDIYGIILRPTTFDPQKQYPVIENIYAGPHGAFVPKSFRSYYASQALAELGFIVVRIDGMGTSYRSKAFHNVCWKNLGDAGLPDRIRWIKAAAKKYPYLDLSRVGIYGGSAGGQSSTRALLAHGDFYKVAVSDCGCHDNRMDKIWWNELWMGWPVGPHYAEQSNVTQAHRLQGKLLLIVAEMDRNVDPASTMQVVNALIKADKDFEMLVVPGAGHGVAESRYGKRRRRDFFVRHLLGVEPRVLP